MIQVKIDVPN